MTDNYDILAIAAHPDDLEVVMGGTVAKLTSRGMRVLFIDLSAGEPSRYGLPGVRASQAERAAAILGVDRVALGFQDRFITDSIEARLAVAHLIRLHRPRFVFTTEAYGVHPDHKAATDIAVNAAFYARLPKWDEVPGGEVLDKTEPHDIERLFFGHCRMENSWPRFDFAVDVTEFYPRKLAALECYESVFQGEQASLLDRYSAEDRYTGSLVGVRYAEPFRARNPLIVDDPTVFGKVRFG